MNGLRAAVGFLIVLPAGRKTSRSLGGANWYPIAGLLVAIVPALTWWGAFQLSGGGPVTAAVTLTSWVAVTGALHLDGLADSADAAFASVTAERRGEILRDVHHGTFAVAAVVLILLMQFAALITMPEKRGAAAIVVAAVAARGMLPLALRAFAPPAGSRIAAAVRSEVSLPGVGAGVLLTAAVSWVALGFEGMAVAASAWVTALGTLAFLGRRFGGVGGDALGAAVVVAETSALLCATVFFVHNRGEAFAGWPG